MKRYIIFDVEDVKVFETDDTDIATRCTACVDEYAVLDTVVMRLLDEDGESGFKLIEFPKENLLRN